MGQREAECAAARRCSTGGAKESGLGAPGGREKSTCAAIVVVDHLPCHVAPIQMGLAGRAIFTLYSSAVELAAHSTPWWRYALVIAEMALVAVPPCALLVLSVQAREYSKLLQA